VEGGSRVGGLVVGSSSHGAEVHAVVCLGGQLLLQQL